MRRNIRNNHGFLCIVFFLNNCRIPYHVYIYPSFVTFRSSCIHISRMCIRDGVCEERVPREDVDFPTVIKTDSVIGVPKVICSTCNVIKLKHYSAKCTNSNSIVSDINVNH